MNTIEAFEEAVRGLGWNTPEAARADLSKHPLAGEYLFEVLQERGVLSIISDGGVIALEKGRKRKDPKAAVSVEWKQTWPDRKMLMFCVEDGGTLKNIRGLLQDGSKTYGHWTTLHALWRLIKDGDVVKSADGYAWSEKYRASTGQPEAGA